MTTTPATPAPGHSASAPSGPASAAPGHSASAPAPAAAAPAPTSATPSGPAAAAPAPAAPPSGPAAAAPGHSAAAPAPASATPSVPVSSVSGGFAAGSSLPKIETYRFAVEPFHVDFTGHLFLGVLGNHLLNAAGRHSHNRGWGIDQLNQAHYTWVLSRLSIELDEVPAQYEHVEVETWVESVMKLFTERNFLIRNADDGRIYGYARSIWAMIDTATRLPSNLLELHDGDILRYVVTPDEKPCPIARYRPSRPLSGEPFRTVPTYYSDVDINGHVNSVKYIEHILDLFPRHLFEQHPLRRFDIAYKAESYMSDTLTFYTEPLPGTEADGQPLAHHIEVRKHVGQEPKPTGETVVQATVRFGC